MAFVSTKPLILQAFDGSNPRIPVWLMRQAGRCLPQYRAMRSKYTLDVLFATPELIAEITCLPVRVLNVDAAILFADILTLPAAMGFDITFNRGDGGPQIDNPIRTPEDIKRIHNFNAPRHLMDAIALIKKQLSPEIPLIAFAGAPFTVLYYLLDGKTTINFDHVIRFAYRYPSEFHLLMKKLTANTISYLNLQKEAGSDLFQLFDTWGGILRREDYESLVLPYVQEIFNAVKQPSIYYLKNTLHLLDPMKKSGADFLSVDSTVDLADLRGSSHGIQGNLYNGLLYAAPDILRKELMRVLEAAEGIDRYIFNLSHGVLPDTDVEKLKFIIGQIHQFPRKTGL